MVHLTGMITSTPSGGKSRQEAVSRTTLRTPGRIRLTCQPHNQLKPVMWCVRWADSLKQRNPSAGPDSGPERQTGQVLRAPALPQSPTPHMAQKAHPEEIQPASLHLPESVRKLSGANAWLSCGPSDNKTGALSMFTGGETEANTTV